MKRFLPLLCSLVLALYLFPSAAFAAGEGNMDSGGGGMGQGTSANKWTPGNDGVRITVVDAETGTAVSTPTDYSNTVQSSSVLYFGRVNKLQYLGGTSLSPQSGSAYSCRNPANPMPTIVSSTSRNSIECNAALYGRRKTHFIFDGIDTLTAHFFRRPHTAVK